MPARRSAYVQLSQLAEPPENPLQEPPQQQAQPLAKYNNNLSLPERLAYDHPKWYQFPYPEGSPGGGRGFCPSGGLQRQSSGSSFADSSLSSDYPLPTLSPTVSLNASDSAFFNALYEEGWRQNNNEGRLNNNNNNTNNTNQNNYNKQGDGACKNWAQQTEESYHLQLALALRLSAEATLTEDPHLLDLHCHEPRAGSGGSARNRAQAMAHRFWSLFFCHGVVFLAATFVLNALIEAGLRHFPGVWRDLWQPFAAGIQDGCWHLSRRSLPEDCGAFREPWRAVQQPLVAGI